MSLVNVENGRKITLYASTYLQIVKISKMAEGVMNAVEALLRKASKRPRGKMQIRR